jgi:hypothetical protein
VHRPAGLRGGSPRPVEEEGNQRDGLKPVEPRGVERQEVSARAHAGTAESGHRDPHPEREETGRCAVAQRENQSPALSPRRSEEEARREPGSDEDPESERKNRLCRLVERTRHPASDRSAKIRISTS